MFIVFQVLQLIIHSRQVASKSWCAVALPRIANHVSNLAWRCMKSKSLVCEFLINMLTVFVHDLAVIVYVRSAKTYLGVFFFFDFLFFAWLYIGDTHSRLLLIRLSHIHEETISEEGLVTTVQPLSPELGDCAFFPWLRCLTMKILLSFWDALGQNKARNYLKQNCEISHFLNSVIGLFIHPHEYIWMLSTYAYKILTFLTKWERVTV